MKNVAILPLAALLGSVTAGAQEIEPRQYSNIPTGMSFIAAGYGMSEGGVLFDPAIALENADINFDGPVLGYARSLALGPFSGKIDAGLAHTCISGSADFQGERVTGEVCGLTDTRIRMSVNFLGAPALSLENFGAYRQDLVFGMSLAVSLPTGQYDEDRLVNVGTNRRSTKLELGMSKVYGRWLLELALAGTKYQTNDDFFGARQREQDTLVSMQGHAVRNLGSGRWLAFGWTYYRGGQTRTDGVRNSNELDNSRAGITLSLPINTRQSLKLNFSRGILTRTGSDFDTLGALWQYRWGGGL